MHTIRLNLRPGKRGRVTIKGTPDATGALITPNGFRWRIGR